MNEWDWPQLMSFSGRAETAGNSPSKKTNLMTDLIFVAVMALFFVAGELYAWWCEKL
jgi:hypothetical protein